MTGRPRAEPRLGRPAAARAVRVPQPCNLSRERRKTGIRFTPANGEEANQRTILETLGVGIALFDYDGDGDSDLFCLGGGTFGKRETVEGRAPVLYRNEGAWRFTDLTELAGLKDQTLYSHGAIVGDCDNDGFPDVLVTGYGDLRLYQNQGDGTFRERSHEAGLTLQSWSTSVVGAILISMASWTSTSSTMSTGHSPTTRTVAATGRASGTLFPHLQCPARCAVLWQWGRNVSRRVVTVSETGKGLGVLVADLDVDGDLDIYVANDTTPNLLFQNDGRGNLTEIGLVSGAAGTRAARMAAWGSIWATSTWTGCPICGWLISRTRVSPCIATKATASPARQRLDGDQPSRCRVRGVRHGLLRR